MARVTSGVGLVLSTGIRCQLCRQLVMWGSDVGYGWGYGWVAWGWVTWGWLDMRIQARLPEAKGILKG